MTKCVLNADYLSSLVCMRTMSTIAKSEAHHTSFCRGRFEILSSNLVYFWSWRTRFDAIISYPHAEVTLGPFIFAKDFHSGAQQVVFHSLGCTRAWGQMEEPHAEPFAIVKEPFTIQIFPSFHDWKRIFLPWTLDWHITTSSGCKKYWSFHFFQQIPVIFRSQFLNFEPSKDPSMLSKFFKCQFL